LREFGIGSSNEERNGGIIVQSFMKELCRRDDEDNRGANIDPTSIRNVFPIEQIRLAVLGAYGLEVVILALRGHILENRDNEPLEFLDDETNVRLTNTVLS
jgi:hypothetical protein